MKCVAVVASIALSASMLAAQVRLADAAPDVRTNVSLDAAGGAGAQLPRLYSLLVSRRGELLLERYYNGRRATRADNIKSAAKSIVSALVGVAIERGQLEGIRQPIAPFFLNYLNGDGGVAKRGITIEDLLTMRSGLESTSNVNYGAWVQSGDWVRYALTRSLINPPGTVMVYSTGNTHLLSAILTKATGASTWQFAQENLAKPMGFSLPQWPRDPQGIYFGGNDMLVTPRQMLSFGELYLNAGRLGDRQIVPAAWVRESLIRRAESRREAGRYYGYGWWIRELGGQQAFYAWGYGGQYIFLVPSLDLVIVTTSSSAVGEERRGHRMTVVDIVERLIIEPIAAASTTATALTSQ